MEPDVRPQKTKPQTQTQTQKAPQEKAPNPKTQKFLSFKNILFILIYFNEYIFSSFFKNPNIFGFWFGLGTFFFWVFGLVLWVWTPKPKYKPKNSKKPSSELKTQNPSKLKRNRMNGTSHITLISINVRLD